MKLCKDCHFVDKQVVQNGPHAQIMHVCTHSECRNPVTGDPIPAQASRQESVFCGFTAKYWKKKEETLPKSSLVQLS